MTKKKQIDTSENIESGGLLDNRVRRYRLEKGMSKTQLAAAVGTTRQHIVHIESGLPVKLDVAISIAKTFEVPVVDLFPGSKNALAEVVKKGNWNDVLKAQGIEEDLLKAGIEIDPRRWTARVLVRGQQEIKLYPIGVGDKRRAFAAIQGSVDDDRLSPSYSRFFRFSSEDREVVVNMDHLIFWQNCWDGPGPRDSEKEEFVGVDVYVEDIENPLHFGVEADEDPAGGEDEGQFRNTLSLMEDCLEKKDHILFEDEDGEYVSIKVEDIAIMEVARSVTHPAPIEDDDLEEYEGEATPSALAEEPNVPGEVQ